jgi:hypothetical protein
MSFPFLQPYAGLGNSLQTAQAGGAVGIGGWVELARTTLGSDTSTIDVSGLPDKRYYMILSSFNCVGNGNPYVRLNSDTGNNYNQRYSLNGGTEGTFQTDRGRYGWVAGTNSLPYFHVDFASNLSTKEKLLIGNTVHQNTAGAANAPNRGEGVWKHSQTSNPITSVNHHDQSGTNFASGSECVVLGWDPADEHTSNFWEELASVDLSGGVSDTLDSGTISAKKYLWVQFYVKSVTGVTRPTLRLNSDTGSNYSNRESLNGGTDATNTSMDRAYITSTDIPVGTGYLGNMFIINNSANEKLIIQNGTYGNTAGAGTAPLRVESVAKWTNTSNQTTSIQIINDRASADFNTISCMKVWGSD